jgi:CrcB protein
MAIAGVAGTLSRYWLQGLVQRHAGSVFPWGTLVVNMAGCFLFGLVWSLAEQRWTISSEVRTIILVGFMGAFTTFSSFAFETAQLMRDAEWLLAGVNVVSQNVCGIALLFLGLALGRWI